LFGLGRGSKFFICDGLGWVGLGQSFGGLGWAGTKKMDPRTTLTALAVNYAYRYWKSVCLPT